MGNEYLPLAARHAHRVLMAELRTLAGRRNGLLAELPGGDAQALLPQLLAVDAAHDGVLAEIDEITTFLAGN
jgi:hypothetical protein